MHPCLLLFAALPVAGPATLLLSDCEALGRWSRVALIDDAKVGGHAIRFAVPAGPASVNLDHGGTGWDPARGGELRFWYRFSGTGGSSLMVKLVAPGFAEGHQATWDITPQAPIDGLWHQAVVDLQTPYLAWGPGGETNSVLMIRTDAADGASLTLDIDQVEVLPALFSFEVQEVRYADGALRAIVSATNRTEAALSLSFRADGATEQTAELPAGGEASLPLAVPISAADWAALPALGAIRRGARLGLAGRPETDKEVLVSAVKPLDLPPRPRLLATDAEIEALHAKAERAAWVRSGIEAVVQAADGWVAKAIELPPRGGQWWHWYADPKTGETLETVSPTQHRNPRTGEVFTGYPYDDVVLSRDHDNLARAVRDCGFAYRYTGEARYAAKAKEILLAYAARYLQYPLHTIHGKPEIGGGHVGPQTLDEAVWLIPVAQGADLIWDTLSDDERGAIEAGLLRPAAETILQHKMSIHNIQCWKNSAVGLVGLLLGDSELVADAVTSPHGFFEQMARGVNLDGQWYEGAWGYHWYTMNAVLPLAEAGERCGLGLYAFERDGHSFRGLFEGPLDLAMPDLRLPAFNDSGLSGLGGATRLYEVGLARYGDPRFAEVIRERRGGDLPALLCGLETLPELPAEAPASRYFDAAGYAILRAGTGREATWLCLKYGPHGGGHGHPDKLNLALYARGQILGIDPGTTRYGVPLQREWFRATIAHNTLTVDEADQKPATGKLLSFGADAPAGLACAYAEAGPIYEGVTYRRAIALCGDGLVLVLDQAESEADHTYDIAWHADGQWSAEPQGAAVELPDKPGYMHLKLVATQGELPAITTAGVESRVAVAAPGGDIWAGTGLYRNANERVPCIVARQRGRAARVGWAIALGGGTATVRLTDGGLEASYGGRTYALTAGAAGLAASDGATTVRGEAVE